MRIITFREKIEMGIIIIFDIEEYLTLVLVW